MIDTNPKKIEEVLTRAIKKIYPSKGKMEEILKSNKQLKIYFGIDPTAPNLHLDHGTNLLILKRFQKLGHQVTLLFGDFTARIGDPTGKLSVRKQLSKKQILENYKNYQRQAAKILDFNSKKNSVKIAFNSQWFGKMKLEEIMDLMSKITIQKIMARDIFRKRKKMGKEIFFHEFLYPLLQGYDSVKLDTDIELGGSDQIFNMLVGRDLMKIYKKKQKFVIAKEILEDPKTKKMLMSKSEGNYISLDEKPNNMYGRIMALPDEVIASCFTHWTEIPLNKIKQIAQDIKSKKLNPKKAKSILAKEIVTMYHNKSVAEKAEKEFNRIFKEKKLPSKIPGFKLKPGVYNILDLLVKTKIASSKSEAKRLVLQKGVKIDNEIQNDWQKDIKVKKGTIIQAGKRKFVKII